MMNRYRTYAFVGGLAVGTVGAFAATAIADPGQGAVRLVADTGIQGSPLGSSNQKTAKPDKTTDLTGGKAGTPHEYADTPVRQGELQEVSDSKWLQKSVKGIKGETLGKITQVLKDQKTGDIEYVVLTPSDSKTALPLRWSQFQDKNDYLQLNMKKEELKTALNAPSAKDTSPDLQEYMDQVDRARSAPKAGHSTGSATNAPAAAGPMGEEDTSKGGASGAAALPEGRAPGLEGSNPSSKR
jgi:sporulation protein YlmC with PRC-barrel domain